YPAPGDDRAVHPTRGGTGLDARPGLGHSLGDRLLGRQPVLPELLRPHRLHRHLPLDRSRTPPVRPPALQSCAPDPREPAHPRSAAGAGRRGGARPGRTVIPRRGAVMIAALLLLAIAG